MMTNDELKKKIVEIIDSSVDDWATHDRRGRIQVHVSTIANILVKAGLNFGTVVSHTATFDTMQQDRINELEKRIAEAEHRAGMAERALSCLARSFAEAMSKNGNAQYLADGFIEDAYRQAEKELSEELKNDK